MLSTATLSNVKSECVVAPLRNSAHITRPFRTYNAAIRGGAKGASLGLAVAGPTAYLLNQKWTPFRHLTLPLKAFFVTSATICAGLIAADKSGLAYEVSR